MDAKLQTAIADIRAQMADHFRELDRVLGQIKPAPDAKAQAEGRVTAIETLTRELRKLLDAQGS
jgi:rubrerythrin